MSFKHYLKNALGWRTNRKLLVISVDDYGNVRLDSKAARQRMDKEGLKVHSRFDAYDALETREDLEALYEVLTSVKDRNGNHAVFTPFALPCNVDFEAMRKAGYRDYIYELLPETYRKLSDLQPNAYRGSWDLWKEGIEKGIMVPQFHGREHLNLKVLENKLRAKDPQVLIALDNRSYTSISKSGFPNISYTAAFEFEKKKDNNTFLEIIQDGLEQFNQVYGYPSNHFNPPGGREHTSIHAFLHNKGIEFLDTPLIKSEHQGSGRYKKVLNWTGKKNKLGQVYMVRNVVFEPTASSNPGWFNSTLKQIEAAFYMNRPAIISSHRVNFCGHIDESNRDKGLLALSDLLKKVVEIWPDVEFISSRQLGDIIKGKA